MPYTRIPKRGWLAVGLLIAVAVSVMLLRSPSTPPELPQADNGTASISSNATEAAPEATAEQPENRVVRGVVSQGDTAGKILQGWVTSNRTQALLDACRKVYSLAMIRTGQPYTVVANATNGSIERFEYEIDDDRKLVVNADEAGEGFIARVEPIHYEYELTRVDAVIDSNLFQAVADAGESPGLAITLADIFGWEVDFIRDIREGDSFSVLVEKRYRDGDFKGYGRVIAATFTNQGETYEAFYFTDDFGGPAYYNKDGQSLRKSFLKAPLSFTRVTSGFSKNRLHPIFMERRPHPGIDYAAPTGTPVKSVANGEVKQAGWVNGYGNQVIVRHGGRMETLYSHLSGFAKGVRKGTKVRQGQVIGYVGATGWATGPHLDFRIRQGGDFVNPAKMMNPRSEPVAKKRMKAFGDRVAFIRTFIDGTRNIAEYRRDMIPDV